MRYGIAVLCDRFGKIWETAGNARKSSGEMKRKNSRVRSGTGTKCCCDRKWQNAVILMNFMQEVKPKIGCGVENKMATRFCVTSMKRVVVVVGTSQVGTKKGEKCEQKRGRKKSMSVNSYVLGDVVVKDKMNSLLLNVPF